MKIIIALIIATMLSGCNVRQSLDLGSAKAIIELQESHNEMLYVLQGVASTDAKFAAVMVEKFPEDFAFKEISKAHDRNAERASALAKVKRDPYASLGDIGALIKRINWLFSDDGIKWLIGVVMLAMGFGGGGKIMQLMGKAKRAHKADPATSYKDI